MQRVRGRERGERPRERSEPRHDRLTDAQAGVPGEVLVVAHVLPVPLGPQREPHGRHHAHRSLYGDHREQPHDLRRRSHVCDVRPVRLELHRAFLSNFLRHRVPASPGAFRVAGRGQEDPARGGREERGLLEALPLRRDGRVAARFRGRGLGQVPDSTLRTRVLLLLFLRRRRDRRRRYLLHADVPNLHALLFLFLSVERLHQRLERALLLAHELVVRPFLRDLPVRHANHVIRLRHEP